MKSAKNQRATYGVHEPGMWWNLDIFGKFAFEIRMDYLYLWKTHVFNFRDFQESPNPLKIPIPTPASDWGGPVA